MARKKVSTAEETVRNLRRKRHKKYLGEEKIRIVLEGLRGEHVPLIKSEFAKRVIESAINITTNQ